MSKDLILFATADWAERYWTNKQRMADQFSELGFRVLYVESFGLRAPGANKKDVKRLFRRLWNGLRRPKKVKDNLWVLSPLVLPFWKNKWIGKFNFSFITFQITLFKIFYRFRSDLVWTYHPFVLSILKTLKSRYVYYHVVDNITAVPQVDAKLYLQREKAFLPHVNAIFVTSDPLKKYYDKLTQEKTPVYYSPNVVDVSHFSKARQKQAEPLSVQSIGHPRLVYCGVLSDFKIDIPLLTNIAEQKPDWQILLIGEEREGQQSSLLRKLKKLSNVHFLGYRAYADLPEYLSASDVGILPLLENQYTRYMFPMKFFEFLAAGLPVVGTPISSLMPYQDLFSGAKNADEFVMAIENALNPGDPISIQTLKDNYSWQARMDQIMEVIQ